MRHLWLGLVATSLLSGCQAGVERVTFSQDGFSIEALPAGWSNSYEKGSVVFRSDRRGLSRATVVIRSVALDDARKGRRSAEDVVSSTAYVLRQLPAAQLRAIDGNLRSHGMRGQSWEVSFVPPGQQQRYERRHAVLVGETHAFHLLVTAPAGELARALSVFDSVVRSISERG